MGGESVKAQITALDNGVSYLNQLTTQPDTASVARWILLWALQVVLMTSSVLTNLTFLRYSCVSACQVVCFVKKCFICNKINEMAKIVVRNSLL